MKKLSTILFVCVFVFWYRAANAVAVRGQTTRLNKCDKEAKKHTYFFIRSKYGTEPRARE